MSQATESALADPHQVIANLQQQLDQRTAERDALGRELADSSEQQSATAEVLRVINSSPGDLAPVFDAIVEKAMRLCEATQGYLFIYDDNRFHSAAIHGEPRFVAWQRQIGPFQPSANTPLGRISRGERIVHLVDV